MESISGGGGYGDKARMAGVNAPFIQSGQGQQAASGRSSEVQQQLAQLDQVTLELQKIAELLTQRLAMVLQPVNDAKNTVGDPRPSPTTLLAGGLAEIASRVGNSNAMLKSLLQRIEL